MNTSLSREEHNVRQILHINPDDFYASVARLKDPELRGRPLLIAHPGSRGGVISASYEARGDGVRPGMSVAQAQRLCPRAVITPVVWELYERASAAMLKVFERYTPLVERNSLDEAFIDVTGCERLFGSPADVALRIQREVRNGISLAVSVGAGNNKIVSHAASSQAKCGRLLEVFAGYEAPFMAQLPIHRLPELDEVLAAELHSMAIRTVGDLLPFTREILETAFGAWGELLYQWSRGIDMRPVTPKRQEEMRSVRCDLPQDETSREALRTELFCLAERLAGELRHDRLTVKRLVVTIVYSDAVRATGGRLLRSPSDLDHELFRVAEGLLAQLFTRRVRIRALILSGSRLQSAAWQRNLFGRDPRLKWRDLYGAIDRARDKFGVHAVQFVAGSGMATVVPTCCSACAA